MDSRGNGIEEAERRAELSEARRAAIRKWLTRFLKVATAIAVIVLSALLARYEWFG